MEKGLLLVIVFTTILILSTVAMFVVLQPTAPGELRTETLDIETSDYLTASTVAFRIELGAVELDIRQEDDPTTIVHVEAEYNVPELKPTMKAELVGDTLRITIKTEEIHRLWVRDVTNRYTIVLGTYNLNTSFAMKLGAFTGSMKLKRLPLKELSVEAGAGTIFLDFSEFSNPVRAKIDLDIGAATLNVVSFGNSNFETLQVNAGAATIEIDFSGDYDRGSAEAAINAGVATLDLTIPKKIGCHLTAEVLGSLDVEGEWITVEEAHGKKEYKTTNYDASQFKLELTIDAGLATVTVKRQ